MSLSPDQVLDQAADYMDRHGKCRGQFKDPAGAVCAAGAIREISPDKIIRLTARMVLYRWLQGTGDGTVFSWSDQDDDKHRVIRGLRTAAKLYRKEH